MYHKVENFAKWKEAFDSFSDIRKAAGEKSFSVGTINDESNTVYVVNEWDSMEAYQAFMENTVLTAAMKTAGVMEKPHVLIFNEVDKEAL